MSTTAKSKNATSTGDSTGSSPERTLWSPRLGRRVLFQAAKDQTKGSLDWLHMDHIRDYCEQSGVDHAKYCAAVRHLSGKEGVQRTMLLNSLKKNLGA